ncbi:MAG: cation:proton antiporter [Anaerolineae bacterium]|nr:cation:proton antiporter [Anaerolineae bacterium]MCX8068406.1 cation:proton antiporter [Anaerolineae bacterium]MDW7991558.1 cation:proton antiporter [Anaerolineae bacterium]
MDPLLQFPLALALIVLAAKASGYLSIRLGQPAVLGELLIGLILGPTVLNMLHWPIFAGGHLGETLRYLAHLGVLFLMFIAGLEVDMESLRRAGRPAIWAGVLGVLFPIAMGLGVSLLFGFTWLEGMLIGLMLAATSVSISAQTMIELGVLRSRVGVALLGAAVVDDILVIMLLAISTALMNEGGGFWHILWVLVRMFLFLALAIWVGARLVPRLPVRVERLPISEGVMALVVVTVLFFAWAAEALGGVAAITGAFLAGLAFARSPLHQHIRDRMHTLAYTWVVPIFFVHIGLEANARSISLSGLGCALALIGTAMLSKVIGCGLGGLASGFSFIEALCLGVGMMSRGEVGLIVASVELESGLITQQIFADVVLVVLATTLVTPILLRLLYRKPAR